VKNIRQALETALVTFAAWAMPKLPRRVILAMAWLTGWIAYLVDFRGRETAHENLRAAFRGQITEEQVHRISVASYQTFARTFLDLFWATRLTKKNYAEFVHIRFENSAIEDLARQRGAIWVTAHFGNFEVVSYVWGFRGFPWVVVAQDFQNPALTEIFRRLRQNSGHTIIPSEGAMLRLVKTLSKKGHAGLLTDLNIKPNKMAAVIECFGLKTCVTTLHTNLAKRIGLPIITGVCLPLPDGNYRVHAHAALEPATFATPRDMAQEVWNRFEKEILDMPEAWLWMYKHWRYLPGKDDERDLRYPPYANALRAFRDLMEVK
jgi:KDO2-lipid IV(A) lauroyltransferase